ncbi:MAG: hypothetical protein O0X49_06740 [Methanocorpusculum sp.]|nr:hypothetical protein [Methanocorpusculum sp.]
MSRSTLTAIVVTTFCFAVAIFGLSYGCVFTEVDGLSIISHGIHVIPPNETALIEKMEQYAEEDGFRNFVGSDGANVADCKREGVVITMRYTTPHLLNWTEQDGSKIQIFAERITVTIPDQPDSGRKMSYYIIVDKPEKRLGMVTLQMPREQANELLKLAGLNPIEKKP